MKDFAKFWWKPPYQRKGKAAVEFELQPLDQRTWLYLKGELRGRGRDIKLTPEGYIEAFRYGVTNWRGFETQFSEESKAEMATGLASFHTERWMEQISGELMRRVLLEDDQLKNS